MLQNPGASLRYRTIWLSDIHLGYRHCKADFLLEFLATIRCDTIFLVGDVLDLWSLRNQWHWPAAHSAVLRALLERADNGTRTVYVPGNHDETIRDFAGNVFGKIAIEKQCEHLTANGRRLLVTHGDEFEALIRCSALTRVLGSASYSALLRLNRHYNHWRAWRGQPYWSLATAIKNRVGNARRAIDAFELAALDYARAHGFDGIVCGHIHQPCTREIDGTVYCNDGDWVENCTALAETAAGELELLHWPRLREHVMRAHAANDLPVTPLPRLPRRATARR
jgi:UDP-2,3-diacylglucosamine pyrophosphatase LpxH